MRNKIVAVMVAGLVITAIAGTAFAGKKRIRSLTPSFNGELHVSGTIAPAFLAPAGFIGASPSVEYYILPGLALGFEFSWGYFEGKFWGLMIDFVNIKYSIVPRNLRILSFYLKTGFGLGVGIYSGGGGDQQFCDPFTGICVGGGGGGSETGVAFDWVFGAGMNIWVSPMVGILVGTETHTYRGEGDDTVHLLRLGVTFALGF